MCTVQNFLVVWGERRILIMMWPKEERGERNDMTKRRIKKKKFRRWYYYNDCCWIFDCSIDQLPNFPWLKWRREAFVLWQYQNRREKKKIVLWQYQCQYRREEREKKLYYGKTIAQIRESREKINCIITLNCAINLFFMLLLLIYRKLNNNM